MAKFCGLIGYIETKEVPPDSGIWKEEVTEHKHYGDLLRDSRRVQTSDKVNDDINISNEISIVADPYAMNNIHYMRYVEFMGIKWKITNVEVKYPRLILTLGGLYNGEQN